MKKIIYLFIQSILCLLGSLSIIYYIALVASVGFGNIAYIMWLMLGVLMLGILIVLMLNRKDIIRVPKWIKVAFNTSFIMGMTIFTITLGCIVFVSNDNPPEDVDYVIVLGAGLNGKNPSLTLKYRLDEAYNYLENNDNTKVVVSGGQGSDEIISEAEAMKNYLVDKGLNENRIIMEDKSTSTMENLEYSKQYTEEGSSIIVISNDFHMLRAVYIAKQCGYEEVYGCGAKSVKWMIPAYYSREVVAVIKDVILKI